MISVKTIHFYISTIEFICSRVKQLCWNEISRKKIHEEPEAQKIPTIGHSEAANLVVQVYYFLRDIIFLLL